MTKLRAGVIGLGMGKNHAKGYAESACADLAALCDLNESLLKEYGALYPQAALYTSYDEMFAKAGLDAVSIALPNVLHAPVAIAAMNAGLHVLCEKPMALNASQAEEMLAVARARGVKLMIHFNYRYSAQSRWLKGFVEEGRLGAVYYARTRWLRARGIPKMGGWFSQKTLSGGGPLIDLGVHRLDLAMWLMGYPQAVSVSASTFGVLGPQLAAQAGARYDVEDLATALIRLGNGATLTLEVSWAGGTEKREEMETAIFGDKGAVIQRNTGEGYDFECLALQDVAGQLTQISPRSLPRIAPSAIDEFIACVLEGRDPQASGENGLEMMRIIDAIYRSAVEHREIHLGA